MERSIAIKKLSKMLGKGFGYRVNTKAQMREEREAIRTELKTAVEARDRLGKLADDRRNELLRNDQDYQEKYAAHKEARKKVSELNGRAYSNKISVGISSGMFFFVKAEGDNWEEVIEKLQAKK